MTPRTRPGHVIRKAPGRWPGTRLLNCGEVGHGEVGHGEVGVGEVGCGEVGVGEVGPWGGWTVGRLYAHRKIPPDWFLVYMHFSIHALIM